MAEENKEWMQEAGDEEPEKKTNKPWLEVADEELQPKKSKNRHSTGMSKKGVAKKQLQEALDFTFEALGPSTKQTIDYFDKKAMEEGKAYDTSEYLQALALPVIIDAFSPMRSIAGKSAKLLGNVETIRKATNVLPKRWKDAVINAMDTGVILPSLANLGSDVWAPFVLGETQDIKNPLDVNVAAGFVGGVYGYNKDKISEATENVLRKAFGRPSNEALKQTVPVAESVGQNATAGAIANFTQRKAIPMLSEDIIPKAKEYEPQGEVSVDENEVSGYFLEEKRRKEILAKKAKEMKAKREKEEKLKKNLTGNEAILNHLKRNNFNRP